MSRFALVILDCDGVLVDTERLTVEVEARVLTELGWPHTAFARELTPVDGVIQLLDHLDRAGIPTCVASSGSHGRMRRTLGLTGLYERFHGRIFSATEVAHGKPAPDLFLHAAQRMGAVPEECAVLEDSVYGVRAAGMSAFGYAGGLTAEDALRAAGATTVHDMSTLRDVLGPPPQEA